MLGPGRILFGTDNPILYMRGRQTCENGKLVFHTDHPFFFNTNREPPAVEAGYTLCTYQALGPCARRAISSAMVRAKFRL